MTVGKNIVGAILVHLTLGTLYTIAVVRGFVYQKHCDEIQAHFTDGLACLDADLLHPDAPYSLQVFFMWFGMLSAGVLAPKIGPRATTALGCACLTSGTILGSFAIASRNEPLFLATYGCLFGFGAGSGFTGPVAILHAWMPENKGLASGIVTAGFGAGTLIFARIQLAVTPSTTVVVPGIGELEVHEEMPAFFLKFGLVYATLQVAGLALLKMPANAAEHGGAGISAPPTLAIRAREMWLMPILFAAQTSGVAVASNYQRDMIKWNGGGKALLAWVVPIGALGNTVGRIIFGQIENMHGFRKALMLNAALLAVFTGAIALEANANIMMVYMFCMWTIFGGNFPLFVANTAKTFGPKFFALNYAIIFVGFGGGGLIVGMSVKSALPALSDVPSDGLRKVFGFLSVQALVVFVVLAAGIVRTPAQVQILLKERLDASLLEMERK
jgi:OFA family oxalate/formate antiporter-like MFS transporter